MLQNVKTSGWQQKSYWKILKIFKPADESKKVISLKPNGWKQKRFLRKLFSSDGKQKIVKNLKSSGRKQKSCWTILKLAVESKKKYLNYYTHLLKENVFQEKLFSSVRKQKVIQILKTSGWKQNASGKS